MRDYAELVSELQHYFDDVPMVMDAADAIEELLAVVPKWISVEERLPEMYDAGILKKIGIMQRSRKVIAAISDGKEWIVDNNAELRDGKWYSDTIRFLEAGKKQFKVSHWMPLPAPPKEELNKNVE